MAQLVDANDIMFTPFEPKLKNRYIMQIDGIPAYLIKSAARPQITFEEVALDYFPNRAQFTLFDNALNWGFDGTKLMIRGGMIDLDGEGHLDYVSQIQGTFNAQDNELFSPPQQAFISSFSMILFSFLGVGILVIGSINI